MHKIIIVCGCGFRDFGDHARHLTIGLLVMMISQCILLFAHSLRGNNIGVAGAQALAEDFQHCTNLQKLE